MGGGGKALKEENRLNSSIYRCQISDHMFLLQKTASPPTVMEWKPGGISFATKTAVENLFSLYGRPSALSEPYAESSYICLFSNPIKIYSQVSAYDCTV